jgi:hypothetical protein
VDDAGATGYVSSRLINRWLGRLEQHELWSFHPAVIHGDIAPDHMLEERGRVSAILDFSTVQVSDPAEDLAPMLAAASPEAAESILESYRSYRRELDDPGLPVRAEFLAEIAVARWLLYGVRHEDPAIVEDARSMLIDLDKAVAEQERQAETARLDAERRAHEAAERRAAAERASARADRETAERRAIRDTDTTAVFSSEALATLSAASRQTSEPGSDAAAGTGGRPDIDGEKGTPVAGTPVVPGAPERRSVAGGRIGIWPRRRERVPTWDEAIHAASTDGGTGPAGSGAAPTESDTKAPENDTEPTENDTEPDSGSSSCEETPNEPTVGPVPIEPSPDHEATSKTSGAADPDPDTDARSDTGARTALVPRVDDPETGGPVEPTRRGDTQSGRIPTDSQAPRGNPPAPGADQTSERAGGQSPPGGSGSTHLGDVPKEHPSSDGPRDAEKTASKTLDHEGATGTTSAFPIPDETPAFPAVNSRNTETPRTDEVAGADGSLLASDRNAGSKTPNTTAPGHATKDREAGHRSRLSWQEIMRGISD